MPDDAHKQGVAAGMTAKDLITSSALQHALAWNVLPLMKLRDLASVAATCRSLRDCAYQRDELWSSGAKAFLPPEHPALPITDRASVQQVMLKRALARTHIMLGQTHCQEVAVIKQGTKVLYSPSFKHCASVEQTSTGNDGVVSVVSMKDGSPLWCQKISAISEQFHRLTGCDFSNPVDWFYGVDYLVLFIDTYPFDDGLGRLYLALMNSCDSSVSRVNGFKME